jgi:biopolymer transport protein ExbD
MIRIDQFVDRQARMEMTPMIDIVFNVLIFFITATSFAMTGGVELPRVEKGDPSQFGGYGPYAVIVPNGPDFPLLYGGNPVDAAALAEAVGRDCAASKDPQAFTITVVAHRLAPFQRVKQVVTACGQAGVRSVKMAALVEAGFEDKDGTSAP